MKTRTMYTCELCYKEFGEPDHNRRPMSILNFEIVEPAQSTSGRHLTLGKNGIDIALCADCTAKVEKALKNVGFDRLYEGCSSVKI